LTSTPVPVVMPTPPGIAISVALIDDGLNDIAGLFDFLRQIFVLEILVEEEEGHARCFVGDGSAGDPDVKRSLLFIIVTISYY